MNQISESSQKLLKFMRDDYIKNGYMYSGSWPYTSLKEEGFSKDDISELQKAGFLQRRNCEEYAFELTPKERGVLITNHNLCSVWFEKKGEPFLLEIQEEARIAADIPKDKSNGFMCVSTMKVVGDTQNPNKMQVMCPFSIGQVIQVEYDLPKMLSGSAYSQGMGYTSGKCVGDFMVTNVICNMLVFPHTNMIELQSLSDDFNKVHPDSRTMLLFENAILMRMRQPTASLEAQIKNAESKASVVSDQSQHRRISDERISL